MADRPMPPIPKGLELTQEQLDAIAGGDCTVLGDIAIWTGELKQAYDNAVDFTSYVIERVVTASQ